MPLGHSRVQHVYSSLAPGFEQLTAALPQQQHLLLLQQQQQLHLELLQRLPAVKPQLLLLQADDAVQQRQQQLRPAGKVGLHVQHTRQYSPELQSTACHLKGKQMQQRCVVITQCTTVQYGAAVYWHARRADGTDIVRPRPATTFYETSVLG